MDDAIIAAYRSVAVSYRCSADDILHDPNARHAFLGECRRALGDGPAEEALLRQLTNLRKRSRLPRSRDLFTDSAN